MPQITLIKSTVNRDGKTVNRYQVFEGVWDNSQPLPVPAKLTYSYKKAMEIASKILAKKLVTVVNTDKEYKDSDIIHAEVQDKNKETK
jgi:DNA-directed RNA polymerase alpha subunit